MLAFPAGHVVTATVLLDGRLTLGTFFCISGDPIRGLRIILALLKPFLDKRARRRKVVVEVTTKTEIVLACTMHRWHNSIQVLLLYTAFYSVFAVRSWTPFQIFPVIHESPNQ